MTATIIASIFSRNAPFFFGALSAELLFFKIECLPFCLLVTSFVGLSMKKYQYIKQTEQCKSHDFTNSVSN